MDFKNAKELLALCEERKLCISDVMRSREIEKGEITGEICDARMKKAYEIMRESVRGPIKKPGRSMGGLLGGEAKMISDWQQGDGQGKSLCGPVLGRAVAYAMAVLETNASMGLIVAAPTAGSSGIVPGVLLALEEQFHFTEAEMIQALYNAGAVGYLAMRNATVAGAVGGCQAEVGVASAMAASAAVELLGSSPKACLDAASTVLMNLLGLVCDPVGGLVEYPCQNRNAAGVAVALTSAEMALAGVPQLIPLDEMIAVMYNVGRRIPTELRETALGGCAAAPSACEACGKC